MLSEAAVTAMRQVLAATEFMSATTPAAGVEAMPASVERYDGTDPVSLLFTETYLAATRDERLRAQIATLVTEFRTRLGDWFPVHHVPQPAATAVLTIDGLLLHRTDVHHDLRQRDVGPESPDLTPVLRGPVS